MPFTVSSITLALLPMMSFAVHWLLRTGSRISLSYVVPIFGCWRKRWSGDSWAIFGSIAPVVNVTRSSTDCPVYFDTASSHARTDSRGVGGVPLCTAYFDVASTVL